MSQAEFLPFVSVIIPTYMRARDVEKAALSALDQTYPRDRYEVIVIDGSSTDETAERLGKLERQHPGRLIFLSRPPLGPSASRNAGAAHARGEILAFVDSDCFADPHWIHNGIAQFAGNPRLGMIQGKTLPPPGLPLTTRTRFVRVEQANCIHDACNMFYRKEAFESVCGFSRDFYMNAKPRSTGWASRVLRWFEHYWLVMRYSGEDSDLGWNVLSRNWEKRFCPEALVFHDLRLLSWFSWLVDEGCYAFGTPRLVRKYPVVRRCLYRKFFLNRAQAFLVIVPAAVVLAFLAHPVSLVLLLPYVYHRGAEPTAFWRGLKRPFRFMVYLPRDLATFFILLASSIRHGRLVV